MNKAFIVSLLLGVGALWVIDATFTRHNPEFKFLDGAQSIASRNVVLLPHIPTRLETYDLHVPYDQVWSTAQNELCGEKGWRLGNRTSEMQNFNYNHIKTVSLIRGKFDSKQDFIPGTEDTDTCVEVRTKL